MTQNGTAEAEVEETPEEILDEGAARGERTKTGRDLPIFVHSDLDDAGLSVYAFRLYGRIARRAGHSGQNCIESLSNMAEGCRMSRPRLQQARDELLAKGLIRRNERDGLTDELILVPRDEWSVPGDTPQKSSTPPKSSLGGSKDLGGVPSKDVGGGMEDTPLEGTLSQGKHSACAREKKKDSCNDSTDGEPTSGSATSDRASKPQGPKSTSSHSAPDPPPENQHENKNSKESDPLNPNGEGTPPADPSSAQRKNGHTDPDSEEGSAEDKDEEPGLKELRYVSEGKMPTYKLRLRAEEVYDEHWAVVMYEKNTGEDLTALQKDQIRQTVDDPTRWAETIITVLVDDWQTHSIQNKIRYYEETATSMQEKADQKVHEVRTDDDVVPGNTTSV